MHFECDKSLLRNLYLFFSNLFYQWPRVYWNKHTNESTSKTHQNYRYLSTQQFVFSVWLMPPCPCLLVHMSSITTLCYSQWFSLLYNTANITAIYGTQNESYSEYITRESFNRKPSAKWPFYWTISGNEHVVKWIHLEWSKPSKHHLSTVLKVQLHFKGFQVDHKLTK